MLRILAAAVALLSLSACAKGEGAAGGENRVAKGAAAKGADAFFPLTVGGKVLRVQVVVTSEEQQRGLMGRKDMGEDDGMVFVYPLPQQMSFWMRNTPTPLDIGFFTTDGTLKEIFQMQPYDETPVRSRSSELKFALEMNQGWFVKNQVKPGAKLDLKALSAALKARGLEPWEYGVR